MKHSRTLIGSMAFTAIVLTLLAGCQANLMRASETRTFSEPHLPGAALIIETRNGAIDVAADPSVTDVEITVALTCSAGTRAEAQRRLEQSTIEITRGGDRSLRIRPVFEGGRRGSDQANFTVRLPDLSDVTLTTSNGRITVRGSTGEADLRTSNGAIEVRGHDGDLIARTSNGRIAAKGVTGAVDARTSNGAIVADLAETNRGPLTLRTSNGAITARLGPAYAGSLQASTNNGSVRLGGEMHRLTYSQIDRRRATIRFGEDDLPQSQLSTSNGSITIELK